MSEDWTADSDFLHSSRTSSGVSFGSPTSIESKAFVGKIKVERQLDSDHGLGNVLLGLDGANRDYDSKSQRKNDQKTYSFYGQVNYPLIDRVVLELGSRYSHVEDNLYDASTYSSDGKISEERRGIRSCSQLPYE
ncbi:TonB-dependent receptor [Vibrio sp. PP-XX7]